MGSLLMAVLAFALVTSVGAGVALHSAGTAPHANEGLQCGDDHNDTVENHGAHEVNESRDDNETAEHGDRDDGEACGPNETSDHPESMDRDVNETEDETSS